MSNETYNCLWHDALECLEKLVKEENESVNGNGHFDSPFFDQKAITAEEAFGHYSSLYVRYIRVFSQLEECYDAIIQPQRRIDIKATLELVICRIIDLRHKLVKCNSPCTINEGTIQILPHVLWEYVDFSNHLSKTLVPVHAIETPIPRYFSEDSRQIHEQRDALVEGYMKLNSNSREYLTEEDSLEGNGNHNVRECTENTIRGNNLQVTLRSTMDFDYQSRPDSKENAAIRVQRCVRGHLARMKYHTDDKNERIFIGMNYKVIKENEDRERYLSDMYLRREQEKRQNQEEYEVALEDLKEVVKKEEGFQMRENLREERIKWVTEEIIKTNSIPDSLEGFYKVNVEEESNKVGFTSKEEKDDKGKKGRNTSSKTNNKGKHKTASIDAEEVEIPSIQIPENTIRLLGERINKHKIIWKDNLQFSPKSERYFPELAKDLIVRDQVHAETTKSVDEMLVMNLTKMKALRLNGKSGKGKKTGIGKKTGKSSKTRKGGGKKVKPLPGERIPEMKNMDTAHMLSILVEHNLISTCADSRIADLIGADSSDYTGIKTNNDLCEDKEWVPPDPTMHQLRKAVTEYCVLPMGSRSIREQIENEQCIRSILFYGPDGCGKTLMTEAVASELGAMIIDLSPSRLAGNFKDKNGSTKLIHMVFSVAKDPLYAPVVIYLDDCDQIFQTTKKKRSSDKNGLSKFQKDLLIYKNQSLSKEDRVLIIGCTKHPELADFKTLKWKGTRGKPEKQGFFERFLYFPYLNYVDRFLAWQTLIEKKIFECSNKQLCHGLDISTLSQFSSGYSVALLKRAISNVLTLERIQKMCSNPITEEEFLIYLKTNDTTKGFQTVSHFNDFTKKVCGYESRKMNDSLDTNASDKRTKPK